MLSILHIGCLIVFTTATMNLCQLRVFGFVSVKTAVFGVL